MIATRVKNVEEHQAKLNAELKAERIQQVANKLDSMFQAGIANAAAVREVNSLLDEYKILTNSEYSVLKENSIL